MCAAFDAVVARTAVDLRPEAGRVHEQHQPREREGKHEPQQQRGRHRGGGHHVGEQGHARHVVEVEQQDGRDAELRGIPVYVLRSNTNTQMENVLRSLFPQAVEEETGEEVGLHGRRAHRLVPDRLGPPVCVALEGWDAAGKGGAMKMGQALSILESALPEDVAAPYRAQLTRLQDAAPPMASGTVPCRTSTRCSPPLPIPTPGCR